MSDISQKSITLISPGNVARTSPRRPARRETRERSPFLLVALATLGAVFIALPIAGLLWRAPWSSLWSVLERSQVQEALILSAITSFAAAGVCVVVGLPLAWMLASSSGFYRRVLRALVLLPMVLPPVVGGAALLFALGRQGIAGQWLYRWWDITLPFTTYGAVLAAVFVALPFFVISVEAGISQSDPRLIQAARTMGASSWVTFRRVTLPLIGPSVLSGVALAWARALGEFGATITFAGNLPGRTQTLPLATFLSLESGRIDEALALSVILLATSAAVLIGLRGRWLKL